MPHGSFVLDEKKREIAARLKELRPLVEEYQRLEAAQRALEGVAPDVPGARRAAARRVSNGASNGSGAGRRGRPRGTGTRAGALELVQANPGIARPDLAEQMGIKQNYLYRVLPGLSRTGWCEDGSGWHPNIAA